MRTLPKALADLGVTQPVQREVILHIRTSPYSVTLADLQHALPVGAETARRAGKVGEQLGLLAISYEGRGGAARFAATSKLRDLT